MLSGPEGMLCKVPSRSRGAVVSEDEGLIVEEDKEMGTFVSIDSSGLGSLLSASGLPAFSARACPRRSRRVAAGFLQVRSVMTGLSGDFQDDTHMVSGKGLWDKD